MRVIFPKKPKPVAPSTICAFPGLQADGSYNWTPSNIGNAMSVDPGMGGTGWAVWDTMAWQKLTAPLASGTVNAPSNAAVLPWWAIVDRMTEELLHLRRAWNCTTVYCELPQFMEGGKGIASAREGDLVKLTTFFGNVQGKCAGGPGRIFAPVPIIRWKGNLPKELCNERVEKICQKLGYKAKTNTDHEWDAIGIGYYIKGFFA